MQIYIS